MHLPSEYALLSHLTNLQETGQEGKWTALCPAHDDQQNSLSVSIGRDGRSLVCHCHAGCTVGDILNATGTNFAALYPAVDAEAYFRERDQKRNKSNKSGKSFNVVATYDYCDERGTLLYQACRLDPKDFRQRRPKEGGGWNWSMKGARYVLYRLPEIMNSVEADAPVFIVEGEKDADRLATCNLIATTNVSGAGKWKPEYNESLRDRKVVILPDNDAAGAGHAEHVARQLARIARWVKIVNLPGLKKKGDVSDWLDAGGTQAGFIEAINATEEYKADVQPIELRYKIEDPHYLAMLFIDQHRGQFGREELTIRYWRERFYAWNSQSYTKYDLSEVRADVIQSIQREFERDSLRQRQQSYDADKQYVKTVTSTLVHNVINHIAAETIIRKKESPAWLTDEKGLPDPKYVLPMKNGLVDISKPPVDGRYPVIPLTPEFFCLEHLSYAYVPGAPSPHFDKTMSENLRDDPESILTLCEFGGYCLTHSTDYQKFLLLKGSGGNGKSVFLAALTAVVGRDNVSSTSLEAFGERFGLEPLIGKLVNVVGDMDRIDQVSEGTLKSVVSGDFVTIDRKGIQPIEISLPTKLIFSTNELPRLQDRSNGIWRRMIYIPFDNEVPKESRIYGMDKPDYWEKLEELPGILNRFLEGLERLRSNHEGFTISSKVRNAIEDYRRDSNPAQRFFEEHYEADTDSFVVTDDIFGQYKKWCENENHHAMSSRNFGKELVKMFPTAERKQRRFMGERQWGYWGIRAATTDDSMETAYGDADSFDPSTLFN